MVESAELDRIIDLLSMYRDDIKTAEINAESQLLTPPGIKFWATDTGIVLGLLFNNYTQYLKYHQFDNVFEVQSAKGFTKEQIQEALPMTPCEYGDLKPGEFLSVSDCPELDSIRLKLPDRELQPEQVRVSKGGNIQTTWSLGDDVWKIGKC